MSEDDWQPNELEYLRSDMSALQGKIERLERAIEEALRLHNAGQFPVEELQRALRGVLGESTTGYALRASPESKEQWFGSWQEREAEIAKLRATGLSAFELAERPARSCCATPWYKPRPKRKRS
jgi:hypothetical protein